MPRAKRDPIEKAIEAYQALGPDDRAKFAYLIKALSSIEKGLTFGPSQPLKRSKKATAAAEFFNVANQTQHNS